MENTLSFQLTIEEANVILDALGDRPFAQVHSLIQKIQTQAESQIDKLNPESGEEDKA